MRGFTKRSGGGADWSDDLIDVAPLGLADADLALSADRLLYKDVKTGPVRLSLHLADSVARLTLEEMQLYDGRGRGAVTLDGRGQAPATTANLMLEGISAQPLLKDALGFEWLEGQSTIAVALAGQGVSEREIVATLNGKVDLATNNGTIDAIDVGKILRGIEQGRFGGLRIAPGEKTPFSELAGTFTIANGIADNQDLRLVSPNMRVTGAGKFDLPARTLDYTVRPKVASLNANTDRRRDQPVERRDPGAHRGAVGQAQLQRGRSGAAHRDRERDRQELSSPRTWRTLSRDCSAVAATARSASSRATSWRSC